MFLFAAANWSSCRLDLERIQKRFDHHLDNFGRAALFAHAEETTSGLELVMAGHRRQEVMLQQMELGLSRQERSLVDNKHQRSAELATTKGRRKAPVAAERRMC